MEPNVRKVRRHVDKERARELRNRLVAFRCRHYDTVLENPDPLVQNGRLDEVLLPLHQMVRLARPWFESEFTAFAESLEVD